MRGIVPGLIEAINRLSGFVPQRGSEQPGRNPVTRTYTLATIAAAGSSGLRQAINARTVYYHPHSFMGGRLEVYAGRDTPNASDWVPLEVGGSFMLPDGSAFEDIVIRTATGSSTAAQPVILVFDPSPFGSAALDTRIRGPEVGPSGAADSLMKIEAPAGTVVGVTGAVDVAGYGVPGVAWYDGATWQRARGTAAALADGIASAAGWVLGGFSPLLWDTVGATFNRARSGAGNVDVGTARTTLANDDPAVVSLAILDDWDESDRCKVNPIAGQAGIAGGIGAAGATTTRVADATTSTATPSQETVGAVSGEIAAANANRRSILIENQDTAEDVYINFGGAATSAHYRLEAGSWVVFTTVQQIQAIRAGSADVVLYIVEESY